MVRHEIFIQCDADRARVARAAQVVSVGTLVTFAHPDSRTAAQNRNMWRLVSAIAKQLEWHGQHYRPDQWRDYFTQVVAGEVFMPAENGGYIAVNKSSSALNAREHHRLTELIEAFALRHGVVV
jgi:hypothetical protein